MFPGIKTFVSICLLACTILTKEVVRIVQEGPQLVEEIASYEWCTDPPKALYLIRRTYWLFDRKQSTRKENVDTPSSHSKVLWSNAEND